MGVSSGGVTSERGQYSAGASLTADYTIAYEYESNTDTNIKFEAVYEDKTPVTITFAYNGTTYSTVTAYVGDSYILPSFDATAAGIANGTSYVLNGYYKDGVYVGTIGDTISPITGDMTLVADVTIT